MSGDTNGIDQATDMTGVMNASPANRAPGPRGPVAAIRCIRHFLRDPLDYQIWLRQFGPVVRTQAGPFVFHSLYDARALRHVFVDHPQRYSKRGIIDDLIPVLGNGILSSEGEAWKKRRSALTPGMTRRAMDGIVPIMDEIVQTMVSRWQPGDVIDVSSEMAHLALAIVGQTLFGVKLQDRAAEVSMAVEAVSRLALKRTNSFVKLPLWLPTQNNIGYRRAIGVLKRQVDAIITEAGTKASFMRLLHEVTDGNHDALRHEVMTFMLAGHETTANTLAWALGHLAHQAPLQERARAEARQHLNVESATAHQLESLPVIDAVISETLRLYPPGWILMRRAESDDDVLGFAVPRNSFMTAPVYALHRNPDCWPDPARFDPDRFIGESQSQRDPLMYVPFGLGPRRCIGEGFARLESRLALARILERFHLQPVTDLPPPQPLTTLRPRVGIRVRVVE